jgi:general stress protein 26
VKGASFLRVFHDVRNAHCKLQGVITVVEVSVKDERKLSDEATKVFSLLEKSKVGMLVTSDGDGGAIRSRPMSFVEVDASAMVVRMFGETSHWKAADLAKDPRANMSVMDINHQTYVSLSGLLSVSDDAELKERLWRPWHLAWYPSGVSDPKLCVLEFRIAGADYWDAPGSKLVQVFGIAKAIATSTPYRGGQHGHVGELH